MCALLVFLINFALNGMFFRIVSIPKDYQEKLFAECWISCYELGIAIIIIIVHFKVFESVMDKRQQDQDFFFALFVSLATEAQGTFSSICCRCGFIAAESIQDMTPSRHSLLPSLHYHNQISSGDSGQISFPLAKLLKRIILKWLNGHCGLVVCT